MIRFRSTTLAKREATPYGALGERARVRGPYGLGNGKSGSGAAS